MRAIQQEIKQVVLDLHLGSDRFRRLNPRSEHKVLQDVKRHFLTDVNARLWGESFRYPSDCRQLLPRNQLLPELCPNEEKKVWLIACTDEESVYDTLPATAVKVLERCPGFPYAVADKKLKWLFVADLEHRLYATGAPAIERLQEFSARLASRRRLK